MVSFTVSELAQLVGLLLGALVFITLIVMDIGKAAKKGDYWVPGHALVLSALTIQLLSFVEDGSALLNRALLNQNSKSTDVQKWNFTEVAEVNFMNCTEVAEVNFMNCTEVISKVNLMNFIQVHSALLDQKSKKPMCGRSNENQVYNATDEALFKDALFMVHCSRVMLCVLIAFFLPGMVRPGYEDAWTTIAALGFAVFLHIFFELLSVRQNLKRELRFFSYGLYFYSFANRVWVIVYGAIISVSLVWLILLLVCATIANKGIRNVTLQRIPLILTNPTESSESPWKPVEDQVLKSWIVARACYPESIIASSALASSAALAVTVCIALSIVSWILQRPYTEIVRDPRFWLKFIITIVEILFILIGGTVIVWRWLTSVAYYGLWRRKSGWRKYFEVEEYWTQWLVELQKPQESPLLKRLHDDDDKKANKIIGREIKMPKVPSLLLQGVMWLQWLVVFFSNVYWLLSELAFTNKVLEKIATKILSKHLEKVRTDFTGYYKDLLSNVNVLSETPESVFLTNRKSIKQAKTIMVKGNKDGENCSALISFLRQYRSPKRVEGIQCLDPGPARDQLGLKFLWKQNPQPALDVKRYFVYPSKRSWKLTAVALINIISLLGGNSCEGDASYSRDKDNFKVYEEAWELMDLVEESDPETDSLLSKAADKKFMTLREQRAQVAERPPAPLPTMEEADAAIRRLADKSTEESKINNNEQDTPVDWEKVVAGITIYNMCTSMDCSSGDFAELVKELQSLLADIIRACIEKVGVALVEESRKWAQEMEERKLLEAVYIAGKARGLMEKLERDHQLHIAPFESVREML